MKRINIAICTIALSFAAAVQAGTQEISNLIHQVNVDEGQAFESPAGNKGRFGTVNHGTVVREDGTLASQWCNGEIGEGDDGQPTGFAGYCTIIEDNGDVLWVSFLGTPEEGLTWSVMGGTGQWAGATGGGTSEMVSMRADGEAWTSKATGKITTP